MSSSDDSQTLREGTLAYSRDAAPAAVQAAFGQQNRLRLIDSYFASQTAPVTALSAWAHVYRLLLWTDQTTALAHCYESDKCQPGKPWYGRSLAFHAWLSDALDTSPGSVSEQIDWMFQRASLELATQVLGKAQSLLALAEKQRRPHEGRGFPVPGEDPELVDIVRQVLGDHISSEPSPETWRRLVQRVRQYLMLDNKRKNLLGEGFEDVVSAVLKRARPAPGGSVVHTRRLLQELPGFSRARRGDKPNKVDIAVIRPTMRTLVTAKWSVRADREKQFVVDYGDYLAAESNNERFEYVFLTNEFDPARLMRACDKLSGNAHMFSHVVHISTDALTATYGSGAPEESMRKVLGYIESGRLISLERWMGIVST